MSTNAFPPTRGFDAEVGVLVDGAVAGIAFRRRAASKTSGSGLCLAVVLGRHQHGKPVENSDLAQGQLDQVALSAGRDRHG